MCVSSDSNIVFPCKICNIIINNKDSVTSASFGFTLNVVNYDPWYCISCCDEILPFGKLPNKSLLSLVNPDPDDHDCFTNNSDAYISKNSSISIKPSLHLSLLFSQFHNSSPEQKTDPENVVNSNFYDIDQLQTLKFPEKNKLFSLFHINACLLNKNFDDLQHLLKCTNKVFDIVAVSETRIMKKTSLTSNINLSNYSFKFTPTESTAGGRSSTYPIACLINHVTILIYTKQINLNLLLLK